MIVYVPSTMNITTRDSAAGRVEEGKRGGIPTPTAPSSSLEHHPQTSGLKNQPYWGLAPLEAPYKVASEADALGCLEGGWLASCNSRVMSL